MISVEVFDNGGATIDQYSVRIGSAIFGMSDNAASANGFNQYSGEECELPGWRIGNRVKPEDMMHLPLEVRAAIFDRIMQTLVTESGS